LALGELFSYFPITLTLLLFFSLLLDRRFKGGLLPLSLLFWGGVGLLLHPLVSIPFTAGDLRRFIDQGEIDIVAQVDRPPEYFTQQVFLEMEGIEIHAGSIQPVHGSFRLRIYDAEAPFEYGDRLRMKVRLRRPHQFGTPGAFQYADYREREGWSGVATLSDLDRIRKVGEGGNPLLKRLYRWRERIRQKILASMEGEPAALLLALIIGETGYLTDPIREVFSASGTTHILSISGSHLALVSVLIFGAVRWMLLRLPPPLLLRLSLWKIPSQCAALATAGPVAFYALLAGAEVATLRSLVMIWVALFAVWIGRSGEVKTTLSLAALLIVAFHPQAIFDLSFQLSFLSVLMITLTFSWWKRTFPTVPPAKERSRDQIYLIESGRLMMLSTLGATLGSAPLTLFYFHQFSWIGLFANLILIPLAGWVIVPFGLLSALFSLLGGEGFPLAGWHQRIGSLYFHLTGFFAHFPGADFHAAAPPLWIVLLFYGVMIWMFTRAISWKWVAPTVAAFFVVFLGVGSLRFSPERLRVSFIDVAQGDATLIEFPRGQTMLIDGGAGGGFNVGRMAVAPYLWERGIRTIDYLVGTHPQMDHIGGLSYIVQKFNIKEAWANGQARDLPFYRVFSEALEAKGLRPKVITSEENPMEIDGCRIYFLNPEGGDPFQDEALNNRSIVLRLVCPDFGGEGFSLLLTGDIEQRVEQRLARSGIDLRSTVLKVPHHGSISSSDPVFLSAVSPQAVLFSVGRNNPYRHPHPNVLAAYHALPATVYRTDQDGAVIIEVDRSGWRLKTFRESRVQKIRWHSALPSQEWNNLKKAVSPF
jgi:competence protein ComEC